MPPSFSEVYEGCFDFVFAAARRLGVEEGAVDDVVQEVFLVVHKRLAIFEGRSSIKTWVFGILLGVVRGHRRTLRRKSPHLTSPGGDPDTLATHAPPDERVQRNQAWRTLHAILDTMDDDRREVFVLAELEEMTAPEIAEILGANLNTVYTRLRAARQHFEHALSRIHATKAWRETCPT